MADFGEAANNLVPELEALLKLWRHRYGAWPVPKRALLTSDDLQPWSRNIALIEHGTDGRFYVQTFGIDLIRRFGRESTGHCIDDLARDIRESLHDSLWRCLSTSTPVAARSSVKLGRDAAEFCELVLPVASASLLLASYEQSAAFTRPR
jgi:hypothetical protein